MDYHKDTQGHPPGPQNAEEGHQTPEKKPEDGVALPDQPLFPNVAWASSSAPPQVEPESPEMQSPQPKLLRSVESSPQISMPRYQTAKTFNIPVTHLKEEEPLPAGINIVQAPLTPHEGELVGELRSRRRVSFSGCEERHNWAVEIKHVIREEPEREREETHENHDDGAASVSSQSNYGDASSLNRQIEQVNLEASLQKFDSIREQNISDDSEVDNEEERSRREELHRLAEENKQRLEIELASSKKLKQELDDETPFGRKLFSSVVVSTIIGGATALITRNKRNSVIAGLVALAGSFIIQ